MLTDAQHKESDIAVIARYGYWGTVARCLRNVTIAFMTVSGPIVLHLLRERQEPVKPQEPAKTEISKEKAASEVLARGLAGR